MDIQIFTDLFSIGLTPIPVTFNSETKIVLFHPEHVTDVTNGKPAIEDVTRWMLKMKDANGVALKLYPPFGMFDFDTKNAKNKNIYTEWFKIIAANNEDVLRKICVERTRNNGAHVYLNYAKLSHKIMIARNDGAEVISLYTGGLLSYCTPSPGYQLIHNDFNDIAPLTDNEFELLLSTAALFNEDPDISKAPLQIINYPVQYESACLQFDSKITDDAFEILLNSIDLFRAKNFRYGKKHLFTAFLRKGSSANYSAKVYFHSKRLLIFSGSMHGFPTWHDAKKEGDNSWSLSPSKILYYKNKGDWKATIDELQTIADSIGIEIIQKPVTQQSILIQDRLKFPYDIFPKEVQTFIQYQSIQNEYIAGAILGAVSTAIGNTVVLEAVPGYLLKPILYIAIVAPPGASKTPALKKAFQPLEDYDADAYHNYKGLLESYNRELENYEKDKKNNSKPHKPIFPQTLIKDSTIEMVVKILSFNPQGCCVLADELSGFLARMNQYKDGDEIQKWLEMWSGSPILLQRIGRDENKVQEPYCSIVGGIQPGVLESLSKEEKSHNGFYHRFLFIYPETENKHDWSRTEVPLQVNSDFNNVFRSLLRYRTPDKLIYRLSDDANKLYAEWFNYKNQKYNKAITDNVKGIIAKYQDYCLRLALLIQVMHDGSQRTCQVSQSNMERAIRLIEYFLGNMHKAVKILAPETPADKLQKPYDRFYAELPEQFTMKTAVSNGETIGININSCKTFLRRNLGKLFEQTERNVYEKLF